MSSNFFDVIVVGAGVIGVSTALYCQQNGFKVLLLEQFAYPHTRGSSHGHSRITRKAYPESETISVMMHEAHELWKSLEVESSTELLKLCGALYLEKYPGPKVTSIASVSKKLGYNYDILDDQDLEKQFSSCMEFRGYVGLFDHEGGVLLADVCCQKIWELFKANGGEFIDMSSVVEIIPGTTCKVKTSRGSEFKCHRLVLSPGPWAVDLLKLVNITLPLKIEAVTVCYWQARNKQTNYSLEVFPCLIDLTNGVYALPCFEYQGMIKLVDAHTNESCTTAEMRDAKMRTQAELIDMYKSYMCEHFPSLESVPVICERCMYTKTPDYNWIIDKHPKHENIWILAGFSGHGFKAGPIIGKIISEIFSNGQCSRYDLSEFSISRF